jgi:hypothetical protein
MKPVTQGAILFVWGWGDFLIFGVPNVFHMVIINPFHQVLNCYLLCSQFIPQVPNVFPIALHFLSFLKFFFSNFLMAQMKNFIAKQNQYKVKEKAKGNTQPAQPRDTLQHSTTLLTHNLCPKVLW